MKTARMLVIMVFVILLFVSQSILHAQIQTDSFEFEGRLRNYMVYLPNNYTGSTNFPLVIYLHCYGWTAQQGMNYTMLNQVADASDFIVVYPSAIPNWNSGIGDNPSWPTPNVDDVGFINALIDTMSNNYSIDLERVYACGYSNGGVMSYKLACQLSHRIAAIASVGGVISTSTAESCNPVRTVPILQIHGTSDPWVPINGSTGWYSVDQTLSYWTSFNDCVQVDTTILPDLDPTDGCTVEKVSYTNCSDNSNVVYYKVNNGGHTWPGAGPAGYPAGNTNQDINAGVEIWNFFKNHKLVTHPVVDADAIYKEMCDLYTLAVETGDIDLYVANYTDDGVQIPPDAPTCIGSEQIRAAIEPALTLFNAECPIYPQEAKVIGNWAFGRCDWSLSLTPKEGGETTTYDGKGLDVLKRQADGSWKYYISCWNYNGPPIVEE